MSPGFEQFDRNSQAYAERYFWPLIAEAGQFVKRQKYPCFVADSTAVRAHVGLARDVGDIDFVFSPVCDELCVVNAALQGLQPVSHEVMKSSDGNILFVRLKLPLDISYRQEHAFIVDIHFGGLVYKGEYSWRPGSVDVFQKSRWMPVKDLSGETTAELPILPLPQVLALKLEKDIGRDECDVLAGLAAKKLDVSAIDMATCDKRKVASVVSRIATHFDHAFDRFCLCYGPEGESHRDTIKERLTSLLEVVGES